MEELQLYNLSTPLPETDLSAVLRPNLWLLSSEEMPPLLFSPEEAGRMLGFGRPKIFRLMSSGELRSIKVGASRRISARALSDFVAQQEFGDSA